MVLTKQDIEERYKNTNQARAIESNPTDEHNVMKAYSRLIRLYEGDSRLIALKSTLDLTNQYKDQYPTALLLAYGFILEPDEEKVAAVKVLCKSIQHQMRIHGISIPLTIQERITTILKKAEKKTEKANKPESLEEITVDDYVPMDPNLDPTATILQ